MANDAETAGAIAPPVALRRTALDDAWLVGFIIVAAGIQAISFGAMAPVLAPLAKAFGGAAAQRIVVGPLLGLAIGGLISGRIIEFLGLRASGLVGAAVAVLAGVGGIYAGSAGLMLAATAALGFGAVILATAGGVALAARFEGDSRARMIGYQTAAGCLFGAGGMLLTGVIADIAGWRAVFSVPIVLGVVVAGCASLGVKPAKNAATGAAVASRTAVDWRGLAPALPLLAAIALLDFLVTTTYTHTPLLLAKAGVVQTSQIALILMSQAVAAMAAAFSYGWLAARIGRMSVVAAGIALGALGSALTGLVPAVPIYLLGCIGMGAAMGLVLPYLMEETLGRVSEAARPHAVGFFQTFNFAGGFLNPFVTAPLDIALGVRGMYVAVGVVSAIGLLALVWRVSKPAPGRPG